MTGEPAFITELKNRDREFGDLIAEVRTTSREDGALSAKTKALIAMALDAEMNHPEGVESLADAAQEEGASEDELLETIEVVASRRGLQGLATGVSAFDD